MPARARHGHMASGPGRALLCPLWSGGKFVLNRDRSQIYDLEGLFIRLYTRLQRAVNPQGVFGYDAYDKIAPGCGKCLVAAQQLNFFLRGCLSELLHPLGLLVGDRPPMGSVPSKFPPTSAPGKHLATNDSNSDEIDGC
eukprot:1181673-Prorocentrum_minimum.AAC.6